ncbi:rhombosortase [Microbulbifer donghaiensis]|uniref:rhombosortase n=1 Tax=Microbulbifer donghaiensis TaxID=494016 RepID=UPI0009325B8F|nr:rhombosortase [Microbulbifer donghaiensis]
MRKERILKDQAEDPPFALQNGTLLTWFAVIAIAGLAHQLPETAREWLVYDRGAIAAGQYWRLASGHFLHTNLNHLLMNCGALAILWYMFGHYFSALKAIGLLSLLCVLCGVGLFVFAGDLYRYVGLSGVLHGLIVWGSIEDVRRGQRLGVLLLLGVSAKIAWEQLGGDTSATAAFIEADVAIAAHLYGAVAGLLIALATALVSLAVRPAARRVA